MVVYAEQDLLYVNKIDNSNEMMKDYNYAYAQTWRHFMTNHKIYGVCLVSRYDSTGRTYSQSTTDGQLTTAGRHVLYGCARFTVCSQFWNLFTEQTNQMYLERNDAMAFVQKRQNNN